MNPIEMINRDRIAEMARRIAPHVRRTPVIEVDPRDFDLALEHPLVLKLELLQHTGSFKPRGAFANMLSRPIPSAGVVAASGGNHGAAVAYVAKKLGVRAKIFIPSAASAPKIERIRRSGAELEIGGERYAQAFAASERYRQETGAMVVHAYDQEETLLGQGSIGLELEEQAPKIDTVLVAVGGGGLIAGIAAWFRGRVKVVGVEPEGAPTLSRAFEAGAPVDAPTGSIAADSLAPARVGEMMFPIAKEFVERVVLVSDDDIRRAQLALWNNLTIVAEPGGATAFAALHSKKYQPAKGERVAVLICGGNSTAVQFGEPSGGPVNTKIERYKVGARMSQAVVHGDTAYLAGQVANDQNGSIAAQTREVLAKIDALLAEVKSDKTRLLSATVWLADVKDYAAMNEVWDAWVIPGHPPARACVESKLAGPGYKVEIAAVVAL